MKDHPNLLDWGCWCFDGGGLVDAGLSDGYHPVFLLVDQKQQVKDDAPTPTRLGYYCYRQDLQLQGSGLPGFLPGDYSAEPCSLLVANVVSEELDCFR